MNDSDMNQDVDGLDYLLALAKGARLIVGGGLLVGVLAVLGSFLLQPVFTASTVVLPPTQQTSIASQALASLGPLAALAGGSGAGRTPLDQYVALLNSTTVADRMIERFKLTEVYEQEFRVDARNVFWKRMRVSAGRRDGLITIEIDDADPQRAQQMAAAMVDEFRRISSEIAVTEAQQRRRFFEVKVEETRRHLEEAQRALQASGFVGGNLKAEPKAAAEGFAKLRAELTAAEVRLQALRSVFTENAPELRHQQSLVNGLVAQLRRIEAPSSDAESGDYLNRFRSFKYHEALYELFSRQLEMARVDEGREGGLLQVVDAAQVPEKKSKPRRSIVGVGASVGAGLLLALFVLLRFHLSRTDSTGSARAKLRALGPALFGRRMRSQGDA